MITALRTGLDAAEVAAPPRADRRGAAPQEPDAAGKEIRRHVEEFGKRLIEERGHHA